MARVGATATPDPGVSKAVEPTPVAATAQPPQTATPPAETAPSTENKGPIPFDRHQAALTNARAKTETELTQRFQQQYGAHVELGQKFESDPVGTATSVIQTLASDPVLGPQIISALARTLGSRRQAATAAPAPDQEPQPDFMTPDGAGVYSAAKLAEIRAYDRQQILREVDSRLQPLQTREQQAQARERYEAATKDASNRMTQVLAPYQALPEFGENKAAIAKKTGELLQAGHSAETALGLAVTHVLRDVVMPARAAKSHEQMLATAVAKATGSSSTPGAAPAAPAGRPTSFESAFSRIAT